MSTRDITVVIGFRDWGVDRLRRSVRSLHGAFGDHDGEIIVSDYGSADPSLSQAVADAEGARWVHTPGDPVWSRSRALNAGFALADGELLISTDADMIFAPGSLAAVHAEALAGDPCAVFLQCRDLPADIRESMFDDVRTIPWAHLERRSRLRPRWGMGGMMAINRDGFTRLRGFDERLHTYGREDIDFAMRAQRAGWRTHWAQDSRARMFHMWHPPATATVQRTEAGRHAISRNRQIVDSDSTVSRNIDAHSCPLPDEDPLVSFVVLPGGDRDGVHRTVATALAQTVHDVEVVLGVSQGSSSEIGLEDARLSRHEVSGDDSSALRSLVSRCRGTYVSIALAGDVLPLDRTESLLRALHEGAVAAHGSSAVGDEDGAVRATGPELTGSTLLIDRRVLTPLLEHSGERISIGADLDGIFRRLGLVTASLEVPVRLDPDAHLARDAESAPVPSTRATALRLLMPADHPGHLLGAAHLPHLHADRTNPEFDGRQTHGGVSYGAEVLRAELRVDDPSYADLARLARLGQGVALTREDAAHRAPARGWVEQIVRHANRRGIPFPLAFHRQELSAPDAESYSVASLGESISIRVTPSGITTGSGPAPEAQGAWLLVGTTIEEVWT